MNAVEKGNISSCCHVYPFKITVNVSDTKFSFRSLKAELSTESR